MNPADTAAVYRKEAAGAVSSDEANGPAIGFTEQKRMLRQMLLIRRFEEKIGEVFDYGKLAGSMFHLSIGQEAIAVGTVPVLGPQDYMTSHHRGHGHMIARGADLKLMMAELFGKRTGYCKGKGGSMHIADIQLGHLGANGIVGGGIAIGTGAALAAKRAGQSQMVLCFLGDGAANEGVFAESLNMAALWRLPIVYLVENNQYAMSTSVKKGFGNPRIADRGPAFGMPGEDVDGTDVVKVRQAFLAAAARARSGEGPTLMVCNAYRYYGHSRMDPAIYRPKEEEVAWRKRDPIETMKTHLVAAGWLKEDEVVSWEDDIARQLDEAVAFADQSPYPMEEDLYSDIYAAGGDLS